MVDEVLVRPAGVCALEPYSRALVDEAGPLVEAHYREIAWNVDRIPLDPDYERYEALAEQGKLRIVTARYAGKLVGYAVFLVAPHLHYRTTIFAVNDVLYVTPGRRGAAVGARLLRLAERAFCDEGVHVVSLHIKDAHNWGKLAERLGYERVESTYLKWIGG